LVFIPYGDNVNIVMDTKMLIYSLVIWRWFHGYISCTASNYMTIMINRNRGWRETK